MQLLSAEKDIKSKKDFTLNRIRTHNSMLRTNENEPNLKYFNTL